MYWNIVVSAWRRVSHVLRQTSSALLVLKKVSTTALTEEDKTVKVRKRQAPMKSHLARCWGNLMVDKSTQ